MLNVDNLPGPDNNKQYKHQYNNDFDSNTNKEDEAVNCL